MTSPREQVALDLLDVVKFGGMDEVYGANIDKQTDAKGKSYWSVTFCKARVLDGVIKIYSPRFIMVKWQTAFRDLPSKGQQIFKSDWDAKQFLHQFVR